MSITLAPYATDWRTSRGRQHPEAPSEQRTPFQRDRDRIIHSTAFRRLKHKTQVFISPHGDHYRTRLTHSLEVAQIARSIARVLEVDEDLTEAIALAHDLGHTPFGHTGEDALDDMMAPYGGFDHNDQAVRVLTLLEHRYPRFLGLNLTWETLEGVVKHNGPLIEEGVAKVPPTISALNSVFDLEIGTHAGLEAQIAAIADDIAYNHHDMDDGLRAGLFSIEEVSQVPHVGEAFSGVKRDYPDIDRTIWASEAVRRLIGEMVGDVIGETERRISESGIASAEDVRHSGRQTVAFTDAMREKERALKSFLFGRMYRAEPVNRQREQAFRTIGALFRYFAATPEELPDEWRSHCAGAFGVETVRVVADYIAGMTDRYALDKYDRLKETGKIE